MDDIASTDDETTFGRDEAHEIFKQFASHYDAPAYVRRACRVEDALAQLLARCRAQRDEWLKMVRIRLGLLRMLAGDWPGLRPWLANEEQIELLDGLHRELAPQPRLQVEPTRSERALRRALAELVQSITRFNSRWFAFLPTVDLTSVNALRDGYNRYYLLEKECAIRSPRLARQGYRPLEPLTTADLAALLPGLPVPQLRE
jgi:hypothetical protein